MTGVDSDKAGARTLTPGNGAWALFAAERAFLRVAPEMAREPAEHFSFQKDAPLRVGKSEARDH